MIRRFVIAIEGFDADQERKMTEYLRSLGGWWHWISGFWLLATTREDQNVKIIRDQVNKINPNARAIVFEFPEDVSWATLGGPNAKQQKMTTWLNSVWAGKKANE